MMKEQVHAHLKKFLQVCREKIGRSKNRKNPRTLFSNLQKVLLMEKSKMLRFNHVDHQAEEAR